MPRPKFVDSPTYQKSDKPSGWSDQTTFYIETENTIFRAHNLTEVMVMWKNSKDHTTVIHVGRFG